MDRQAIEALLVTSDAELERRVRASLLGGVASVCLLLACTDSLQGALSRLARGGVDALLIDIAAAGGGGAEAVSAVLAVASGVAVVALAGEPSLALRREVLRRGAQDCLGRAELDGNTLARSVCHAVERQQLLAPLRARADDLWQSEKMVTVGRLASGMAHDLGNMLQVIIGFAELLLADPEANERQHRRLVGMRRAAEAASALTRRVLDFARKEAPLPQVLDVNALLRDEEPILRQVLGEGSSLVLATGSRLGLVRVDRCHLGQVLLNLVLNARDAMPRGGKVSVETRDATVAEGGARPGLAPGLYVVIAVCDEGEGLAAEARSRLFEPFFTTKERGRGTGLGLWSADGIVRMNGGFISVSTEPGCGTCFEVHLPSAAEAARPAVLPEGAPTSRDGPALSTAPRKTVFQ